MNQKRMTVIEIAAALGVSRSAVYEQIRRHKDFPKADRNGLRDIEAVREWRLHLVNRRQEKNQADFVRMLKDAGHTAAAIQAFLKSNAEVEELFRQMESLKTPE
jgi:predicted DNA-binding transcriptional regulator AlpA